MRDDSYYDLANDEKDRAIRFLLEAVIRTREKHELPSNFQGYDEDVNIYLAHLLYANSTPAYTKLSNQYVVQYASDFANLMEKADDNYIRYFIYKINADHLLLLMTVFRDSLRAMILKRKFSKTSELEFGHRAREYYDHAAWYNRRLYHKETAVGDILIKLSKHFDVYCSVLQAVRQDYFHYMSQSQERKYEGLMQDLKTEEKGDVLKKKQDEFLDLYLEWMKDKENGEVRERLRQLSSHIRQLDPEFQFKLD